MARPLLFTICLFALSAQGFDFFDAPQVTAALTDLYHYTNGNAWKNNSGWLNGQSYCGWYGIECVHQTGIPYNIATIYLDNNNLALLIPYISAADNNLRGELPDIFGLYSRGCNLSRNNFEGAVPQSLFIPTTLLAVRLSGNFFNGSLPIPTQAPGLLQLDLSYNHFDGTIPDVFQKFPSLMYLDVRTNQLRGPLPSSLGGLANLTYVDMSSNRLEGTIPSSYSDLYGLQYFSIFGNLLYGAIPSFFNKFTKLQLLDLSINSFTGTIPQGLESLQELQALRLQSNQLVGSIPDGVYQLTSLVELALDNNHLTGYIGDLSNLSNLWFCWLSYNQFTGPFPMSITFMPSLLYAVLTYNNLTGPIVDNWPRGMNLTLLDASHNQLSGPIPATFSNLNQLRVLALSDNRLMGGMDMLRSMTGLNSFDLSRNLLSGHLPQDIFYFMGNLVSVKMSENNCSGILPYNYSLSSPLNTIDMSSNRFVGSLLDSVKYLINLQYVNFRVTVVSGNSLSGSLPAQLSYLSQLRVIDLSGNKFTGVLPAVGGLRQLQIIRASNNQLYGDLPASFQYLKQCTDISVSGNRLVLSDFNILFSMIQLQKLDASNNIISGRLVDSIGNMTNLQELDLSYNMIPGELPAGLFMLRSLRVLKMNNNNLTGTSDPLELDLSRNNLTGGVEFMATLSSIQKLNISQNGFTGQIPQFLIQHQMESLDLSYNRLEGFSQTGPLDFTSSLSVLGGIKFIDLSNNVITGPVPSLSQSQHPQLTYVNLRNNQINNGSLIGAIYNGSCDMSSNPFQCPINPNTYRLCNVTCTVSDTASQTVSLVTTVPKNQQLLLGIASQLNVSASRLSFNPEGLLLIAPPAAADVNQGSANYTALLLSQQYQTVAGVSSVEWPIINSKNSLGTPAVVGIAVGVSIFVILVVASLVYLLLFIRKRNHKRLQRKQMLSTLDRLLLKDVTVQGIVGQGNFGKVYRGEWNGAKVAIKGVRNEDDFRDNQFKEEILLLQKLNHPNIIRLLGVYIMNDSSLNMVLEYADNGSLDVYLKKNRNKIDTEFLLFMVGDLINGMMYLQAKSIIHRDLAARNLLLDAAMNIKISDFGLSREDNVYNAKTTAIPYRWAAPEVIQDGVSTLQSDVWSFGVVVWEIFTGALVPYRSLTNREVSEQVPNGLRLEEPESCPPAMWEIVTDCWAATPTSRPSFDVIRNRFNSQFSSRMKNRDEVSQRNLRSSSMPPLPDRSLYHTEPAYDKTSKVMEDETEIISHYDSVGPAVRVKILPDASEWKPESHYSDSSEPYSFAPERRNTLETDYSFGPVRGAAEITNRSSIELKLSLMCNLFRKRTNSLNRGAFCSSSFLVPYRAKHALTRGPQSGSHLSKLGKEHTHIIFLPLLVSEDKEKWFQTPF
ncbi:hypothetical protein PROFUN_06351 [Planoprotostelium fungivorum]|uniref:Protein kinase domain-containing protein n=1 Tax=Planoprotostelium fungivorum TaxID=1890364 RepID=A0A2P6NP59_9EUKA|nr:hypothetical protein PROFUN_06351 [Planoprotostelium fungivorum]